LNGRARGTGLDEVIGPILRICGTVHEGPIQNGFADYTLLLHIGEGRNMKPPAVAIVADVFCGEEHENLHEVNPLEFECFIGPDMGAIEALGTPATVRVQGMENLLRLARSENGRGI
jgi:hypothetical protein